MVYKGSKSKLSKDLAPIIQNFIDKDTIYIEPFVGGANMIDKIKASIKLGVDIDKYVISVHKVAQQKEIEFIEPKKEIFYKCKYWTKENNGEYLFDNEKYWIGYYRVFCSFQGGGFNHGYGISPKDSKSYGERIRNINKQRQKELYKDIIFKADDYKNIVLEPNKKYVIYLDPPYQETVGYNKTKFNHQELWEQCKKWKEQNPNIIILLSELKAPEMFREIWNKDFKQSFGINQKEPRKEKLFIYERE